jgi:hypothetical protein
VHELGSDGGGVDAAGFLGIGGVFVGEVRDGEGLGREELAEGVEGGLEVAPAAEEIEGCLAGCLGACFSRCRRHALIGWHGCGFGRGERLWNVMRITDGRKGEA